MSKGYIEEIRKRIQAADAGSVFVSSDFADIANTDTIRKSLYELVQKGLLVRVFNGIFEKPEYSDLLGEYVAVDPDKVAQALARSYHWTITPCGNTALNLLGLSTQVPASWTYISDGPYRTFQWEKNKLEFKHRTNKEISGLSYITRLVIQALKTLGKDNVTEYIVDQLSERLSDNDKSVIFHEASESTDWVYDTIRKICKKGGNSK